MLISKEQLTTVRKVTLGDIFLYRHVTQNMRWNTLVIIIIQIIIEVDGDHLE